ncbi:MAG: hypothetical protein HC797_04510 [Anaerolineales bacterium]|nr:hypothetical protein [Anaerolineales bacterium]
MNERKKMLKSRKFLIFTTIIIIIISACGANTDADSAIQTAVAQTVAAQNQNQPITTETPSATLIPTQTPYQLPTSLPTLPSPVTSNSSSKAECAKASLQDESIVDGTIYKPGEQFTKTWYITNTSNCVWDTSYKIIFWDGNVLGGGYVYNLPQITGPGQTIPVALVLTAPTADGSYRSEWKLQTPDNINFGVGYLNAAFYTEIVVSSDESPEYAITNVELTITREPAYGCQPANMVYTAYATFTTNGPLEFIFRWGQQDGNNGGPITVEMTSATQKTFTRVWKLGRAASQNDNRWFQIVLLEPVYKEYSPVGFSFFCP